VALEAAPALVGAGDDPAVLEPRHPIVRELARRMPGLRICRTGAVMEALVPAIIEQKVTGTEARRAYQALIRVYGEPAPGPAGLRLPPSPDAIAALPYHAFHPLGVERRRADTLRRAASRASALEVAVALPLADAYRRLMALPGIGPWTAAEVAVRAVSPGDPDAVSARDFHPEPRLLGARGRAARRRFRMLELLEPYSRPRGRVVRLLEASASLPALRPADVSSADR
jgi:3-methyladenine DNA glycosylase/8-oxoguanine DNA glycosylase